MKIITARAGDSPGSLERRWGLRAGELVRLNGLSDPRRLTEGLALAVPEPGETPDQSFEIGAVAESGLPDTLAEELLGELSYFCPFCRCPSPEGDLRPEEGSGPAQAAKAGVPAMLTVANLEEGGYSAALAHALLATDRSRRRLLESLLTALKEGGYSGVYLSFCYLHPFDRENYNAFLRLAAPLLHSSGLYLMTALAPKEDDSERSMLCSAHDYALHGQLADRCLLLAYDWGYAYSAPQAVSPLDRIRSVLDYAAGKLPLGKLSLGVSGRGYSWPLPWRLGTRAEALSRAAAEDLAVSAGAEIRLDPLTGSSSFTCSDALGGRRRIWFEDLRSLKERISLAEEYGLAGLSLICGRRPDLAALRYLKSRVLPEKLP